MSPANNSWRIFTLLGSSLFFAGIIALTTLYGAPTNSLHTSAQQWGFACLILNIGVVVGADIYQKLVERRG